MAKTENIKEMDGKYYLELPCLPGMEIYSVSFYLWAVDGNKVRFEYQARQTVLYTVEDIVRNLDQFGARYFLTEEEAVKRAEELNNENHI